MNKTSNSATTPKFTLLRILFDPDPDHSTIEVDINHGDQTILLTVNIWDLNNLSYRFRGQVNGKWWDCVENPYSVSSYSNDQPLNKFLLKIVKVITPKSKFSLLRILSDPDRSTIEVDINYGDEIILLTVNIHNLNEPSYRFRDQDDGKWWDCVKNPYSASSYSNDQPLNKFLLKIIRLFKK